MKRVCEQLLVGVLVATSLVWNEASHGDSSLQAAAVLADIKTQGAAPVVAKLRSDNARWNEVMAGIGQGQHEWLEVARALRPGTDAGASEGLDEAVFLALKTAPSAVLQLLKDGSFDTRVVCSSNIGTDYSPAQAKRLVKDRVKALEKISNPATEGVRTHCLEGLRAALADLGK